MPFFKHLIHHIKKGRQICAGSMVLGEPAIEEYLISDTAQECINLYPKQPGLIDSGG